MALSKKLRITALLLAALMAFSACGTRLDKTSEFLKLKNSKATDMIDSLCRSYVDEHGLMGLSVGVLIDGRVRFFNYGTLSEGGATVTEDTRFDMGTLTQVFTGVAFGESVYRRYLSHDSSLKKMFPYLNLPLWEDQSITFGQLATHTSGLPSQPTNLPQEQVPYAYYDEMALRRYLSTAELTNEPGTVYNPEGMDMGLLGFGLEVARKWEYEQHMKNVIMYSIGMTRTTATFAEDDDSHLASWATPHDAAGNPLPHQEYSTLKGMASFKTTAYDMMLFAWCNLNMPGTEQTFTKTEARGRSIEEQLYHPAYADKKNPEQVITSETIGAQSVMERLHAAMRIARDEHYSEDGLSLGYGYQLGELELGGQYVWQAGGDAGNGGYIGFTPENNKAVVALSNTGVSLEALGAEILSIIQ